MSEPIAEGWVSATSAGEAAGYATAYVRLLARQGRIEARKAGRDWLVNLSSLLAYKRTMESLGDGKHNPAAPWRDDT